jgi:hypothetical protein
VARNSAKSSSIAARRARGVWRRACSLRGVEVETGEERRGGACSFGEIRWCDHLIQQPGTDRIGSASVTARFEACRGESLPQDLYGSERHREPDRHFVRRELVRPGDADLESPDNRRNSPIAIGWPGEAMKTGERRWPGPAALFPSDGGTRPVELRSACAARRMKRPTTPRWPYLSSTSAMRASAVSGSPSGRDRHVAKYQRVHQVLRCVARRLSAGDPRGLIRPPGCSGRPGQFG